MGKQRATHLQDVQRPWVGELGEGSPGLGAVGAGNGEGKGMREFDLEPQTLGWDGGAGQRMWPHEGD